MNKITTMILSDNLAAVNDIKKSIVEMENNNFEAINKNASAILKRITKLILTRQEDGESIIIEHIYSHTDESTTITTKAKNRMISLTKQIAKILTLVDYGKPKISWSTLQGVEENNILNAIIQGNSTADSLAKKRRRRQSGETYESFLRMEKNKSSRKEK